MTPTTVRRLLADARAAASLDPAVATDLLSCALDHLDSEDDATAWDRVAMTYARLLVKDHHWDAVSTLIRRALDHDGSEAAPRIFRLAVKSAPEPDAVSMLEAIAPERVFDLEQLLAVSLHIARRGRHGLAEGLIDRVSREAGRTQGGSVLRAEIAYHAGRVLYMTSRRAEAVEVWRRGLNDDGTHTGIVCWLSMELERAGAFEECLAVLNDGAIEDYDPPRPTLLARRAHVVSELATRSASPSVAIGREGPDGAGAGARVALVTDDTTEEERLLLRAIRVADADGDAEAWDRSVFAYAQLLLRAGRWNTLAGWLLRGARRRGSAVGWRIFRLTMTQAPEPACTQLLQDLTIARLFSLQPLLRLSARLTRMGRHSIAERLATEVVVQASLLGDDVTRWQAEYQRGRAERMGSNRGAAIRAWRQAFADGSRHVGLVDHLTRELARKKAWLECCTVADSALARFPDGEFRRVLKERRDWAQQELDKRREW